MREPVHIGRVPAPNNVSALVLFIFSFWQTFLALIYLYTAHTYDIIIIIIIHNSVAFYLHSAGPLLRCPTTTTSGNIIPKPAPPEPMTFNAFMTAARDCTRRTFTTVVLVTSTVQSPPPPPTWCWWWSWSSRSLHRHHHRLGARLSRDSDSSPYIVTTTTRDRRVFPNHHPQYAWNIPPRQQHLEYSSSATAVAWCGRVDSIVADGTPTRTKNAMSLSSSTPPSAGDGPLSRLENVGQCACIQAPRGWWVGTRRVGCVNGKARTMIYCNYPVSVSPRRTLSARRRL